MMRLNRVQFLKRLAAHPEGRIQVRGNEAMRIWLWAHGLVQQVDHYTLAITDKGREALALARQEYERHRWMKKPSVVPEVRTTPNQ